MGLSAKHLDDRASDAIKTSTTAMDTVAELKTSNAVLSTRTQDFDLGALAS
jgi:hypothetical protein